MCYVEIVNHYEGSARTDFEYRSGITEGCTTIRSVTDWTRVIWMLSLGPASHHPREGEVVLLCNITQRREAKLCSSGDNSLHRHQPLCRGSIMIWRLGFSNFKFLGPLLGVSCCLLCRSWWGTDAETDSCLSFPHWIMGFLFSESWQWFLCGKPNAA